MSNRQAVGPGGLKVRESPTVGVFVEDLSTVIVKSFKDVEALMDFGQTTRTVANTNMNATSSRSHSIFTVVFTQTKVNKETLSASDTTSKINLVDLAGSERQSSTGATGDRLKEGCAINKSLSALGNVISALADDSQLKGGAKKKFIPYRDSILTRLLQQSLGGNSKTAMIAALSPADINYEETLSTLRYADRAKKIVNRASINEEPNEKLIRELRAEIERLRKLLEGQGEGAGVVHGTTVVVDPEILAERDRLREELAAQQKLMERMSMSDKERLKTQSLMFAESAQDRSGPHFTNLHEDPTMAEKLVYPVKPGGTTAIGRKDADEPQDIVLRGLNISKAHARVVPAADGGGGFTLEAADLAAAAHIIVNGRSMASDSVTSVPLHHNTRVLIGMNHLLRFVNPKEQDDPRYAPPAGVTLIDWEFAQEEISANTKIPGINHAADEELAKKMRQLEKDLEAQKQRSLLELEVQREALAASASEEAHAKFEAAQKQLQEDNRRLEAQLLRTRQEEAERQRKFLLEDQLIKLLAMCQEANSIAEELSKDYEFSPKLLTVVNSRGKQLTEPGVKVTDFDTGEVCIWDFEKFQSRLFLMRDLYAEFIDWAPAEDADEAFAILQEEDPFYDPPNSNLIGRAQVHPNCLAYGIDFDDDVPLFDYLGHTRGKIHIAILPLDLDGTEADAIDDPLDALGRTMMFKITLSGTKDLPVTLKPGFMFRFKFYEAPVSSTAPIVVGSPPLAHSQTVIQEVSHDFLDFLTEGCLFVELFGDLAVDSHNRPMRSSPGSSKNPLSRLHSESPAPRKRTISLSGLNPLLVESLTARRGSSHPPALNDPELWALQNADNPNARRSSLAVKDQPPKRPHSPLVPRGESPDGDEDTPRPGRTSRPSSSSDGGHTNKEKEAAREEREKEKEERKRALEQAQDLAKRIEELEKLVKQKDEVVTEKDRQIQDLTARQQQQQQQKPSKSCTIA
jgi:kinesin family protein 13